MVKLLLRQEEIDPDKQAAQGQTPLSWAARDEREGVVKILLGRDDISPISQLGAAEYHSGGLPAMGVREWSNYYST